ncbi:tyrosinase precursor [Ophiostoma piceae UAMH 11346]|uniref:Tyrosinase n=1 Tax=Ophiostoma piceae (strain UAMH 11346) TaxID=1262450 RepID=S3C8M1_OPHP1|nr:tyrosinase precursor [Ophiostoma piceae UAMH 11346]EPE03570.1 tyrosinase precursor [Ophiostoma piceae UAMH 11346]
MHLLGTGPPRSFILWGIAAASWMAPAAAQQVVGVTTGINNGTGERPSRVNINNLHADAGPHWDLYVQALDLFQREDMTELLSYYQITGIHGLPFQAWNGVNQVSGGANTGYCPHGQTTFITWHRPYLALYEQTLASYVQKVAKQYPVETVDTYTAAADTFRIPYWDWAVDAHLPPAITGATINYNGPAGAATMRNPLYSYQFPNFPFTGAGGFGGGLTKYNETKRCIVTTGPNAGVSDPTEGNSVLMGDAAGLQDKVYAVFTQSFSFESMATMSNSGASFEEPHNVIHNDISCFSVSGRTGHMGDLNWSGFDPIFFLHHVNVDRLFAMWQAINYDDIVFTTEQQGDPLFGTAGGDMTADSPLRPFAKTVNADGTASSFHTSRTIEDIATFGYTYPEIDDWSQDQDSLADSLRTAVNNLYGPAADTPDSQSSNDKRSSSLTSSLSKRFARPERGLPAGKKASTTINDALATFDYSIELSVDRSEIPLPSTIELYLIDVAGDIGTTTDASSSSSNSTGNTARIGTTSILSMPMTGTSYSVTPLRRILVAESASREAPVSFADTSAVLAHIRKRLRVVIKTSEGEVVPLGGVPSLTIEVQQRAYQSRSASNKFPSFGSTNRYPMDAVSL